MTDRDRQRLVGVHPKLVAAIERILSRMSALGFAMFVVQGLRTDQEQANIWAQGRTLPGKVVTMKDGIIHRSNHQTHADGFGHAVDCAFSGPIPFSDTWPWEKFGEAVEAEGLTWGGRWAHPHDSPHAELPDLVEPLKA